MTAPHPYRKGSPSSPALAAAWIELPFAWANLATGEVVDKPREERETDAGLGAIVAACAGLRGDR